MKIKVMELRHILNYSRKGQFRLSFKVNTTRIILIGIIS
jgi:hypothetical protein